MVERRLKAEHRRAELGARARAKGSQIVFVFLRFKDEACYFFLPFLEEHL
jgi:hypothetical protein